MHFFLIFTCISTCTHISVPAILLMTWESPRSKCK
ncbi:Uncharacterized protein CTYZ_00003486, partial [Cryptosporidium tyzzeri]